MLLDARTQTEATASSPAGDGQAPTYRPKDCKPNHSVLTFNGLHFLPISSRTEDAPVPPEGIRGYYKHAARGTHFYTREGVIEAYAPTNMRQGYFIVTAFQRPEGIHYMYSSTLVTERFMGIENMGMSKQSDALRAMSFTPLNRMHHLPGVRMPGAMPDAHQPSAENAIAAHMCYQFPGGSECISQVQVCPSTGEFDASLAFQDMLDFSEGASMLPDSEFLMIGAHRLPVTRLYGGGSADENSMPLKVTDLAALKSAVADVSSQVAQSPAVVNRHAAGPGMR